MSVIRIHRINEPNLKLRAKSSDYLSFYENQLGIKWDHDKFEVHHIDCDHSNNVLGNLVLLPRFLHRAIHGKMFTKEEAFDLFCTSSGYISKTKLYRVFALAELKECVSEYIRVRDEILRGRIIFGDDFNQQEFWDATEICEEVEDKEYNDNTEE